MSADNPTSPTADKPVPVTPAPAETNDGAGAYDPDLDDLADEALSEPPINYGEDPVSASAQGVGENQGSTPAASFSTDGQDGAGHDGAEVTGAPGARDQGSHQVPDSEGAGSLEQSENEPGLGVADGRDVYDPDLDALADEALSEPPIDYNEDPDPVRPPAPGHDAVRGHDAPERGAGESETESSGPQRPGRANGQQQDGQLASARASQDGDTEPRFEDDANGKPDSDPAAKADTPAPQLPYSDASQNAPADEDPALPADGATTGVVTPDVPEPRAVTGPPAETEAVTEADSGQGAADAALTAAPTEDLPVTPETGSDGELSGEAEPSSAERPEDPAALTVTPEAVAREPGPAEPDPDENAEPGDPLAAVTAELGTGGDTEPGETAAVAEAEQVQTGTTEHEPQTQDPEPEPVLALGESSIPDTADASPGAEDADNAASGAVGDKLGSVPAVLGATSEHDSGSEDSGSSGPKPPDRPGPDGDTGNPIKYWHSESHGRKMEFYSNMAGTDFISGAAMRAAVAQARRRREQGKIRAGSPHGITDFPHDRDLGSNTVGDNPGVRLGDTADTRTFGEKMTGEPTFGRNSGQEANEAEESRGDEILDEMMEDADDYQDAVSNATDVAHDFFLRGSGPTGTHLLHSDHAVFQPAPSQGLNPGDMVGNIFLVAAFGAAGIRHIMQIHRGDR